MSAASLASGQIYANHPSNPGLIYRPAGKIDAIFATNGHLELRHDASHKWLKVVSKGSRTLLACNVYRDLSE